MRNIQYIANLIDTVMIFHQWEALLQKGHKQRRLGLSFSGKRMNGGAGVRLPFPQVYVVQVIRRESAERAEGPSTLHEVFHQSVRD